jgi:hypothetical protein
VLFDEVNDGTFPLPPEVNPIEVLSFVHVNVAPAGVLVNEVAVTLVPGQTENEVGVVTVAVGFTVIV